MVRGNGASRLLRMRILSEGTYNSGKWTLWKTFVYTDFKIIHAEKWSIIGKRKILL